MSFTVDPIAPNNYLRFFHDLANLKILNNLKALNAAIAVNVPPDIPVSKISKTYSDNDTKTIKASNTFKESLIYVLNP